jgi:hypothetical protein
MTMPISTTTTVSVAPAELLDEVRERLAALLQID